MNISIVNPPTYVSHLRAVVHDLRSIAIQDEVPAEVGRLADGLFERLQETASYRSNREARKQVFWRQLVYAAIRAVHVGGCVRYSRANANCPKSFKRVIRCAKEAGLFHEVRSRRTNKERARQSRLLPTADFCGLVPRDPWEIEAQTAQPLVQMRGRESKNPLSFDPAHPSAVASQQKLELVNAVSAGYTITYRPAHDLYAVQMRPIQWVLYHEHWWHGRIYIERGGSSESLTKKERFTIQFDGEPSVELDFAATHARLAYHLRGLEYPGDPYHLWREATTSAQRQLAKLVVNTALNAKSRRAAIGACFQSIRIKTKEGEWKEGNKRQRAGELRTALCQTLGLTTQSHGFYREALAVIAEVYDLAIGHHKLIAADFGADAGAWLMTVESCIALDVLHYFALRGVPVLGVHDSFIVPESHGDELRHVMEDCYRQRLGFTPVVK